MAKSDKDPFLGSRVREYQILESIGRGGMGAVYRARHIYLDKERAIKVVHRSLTESQDFVQRFIREAKVLSELNHPNVVQLFDFGMLDDSTFFMVMELIRGETVIERIQKQTRLLPEESVRIVREAALGLSSAHKKGIIHRDISPDNLIIVHDATGQEVTKVVDFGIAKPLHEDTGRFTMTNFFIGKPEYSSPEQCGTLPENERLDERSDIYSLGVTFFQMLTGRLPFVASTPQGYLLKHANEMPQPPSTYVPYGEISDPLDAVVMKTLRKKREDRFKNLQEFVEELDHITFTEGPTMTSLNQKTLSAQKVMTRDETLRVDRNFVLPPVISFQDLEDFNAPTESVPAQRQEDYAPTTPLQQTRLPQKKSNAVTLAVLLSSVLFFVVAGAGYYFYSFWEDKKKQNQESVTLDAAEEALKSGNVEMAEDLLKQAESENRPQDSDRILRLRDSIADLRNQRQQERAQTLLNGIRKNIQEGKLEEASAELEKLQNLNLSEFQSEIQSAKREIESQKRTDVSQQEANKMLEDIRRALETGNLDLSESKLKDFEAGKFPGFERQRALIEEKLAEAKNRADLAKGNQLLDSAEKFIERKRLDLALERIESARELKIASLDSRIESLMKSANSLQMQIEEDRQKIRSLLSSARLLIQVGQPAQAQDWLAQARALNMPEFKAEIDSLSRQAKAAQQKRATSINAIETAESAIQRGDWIEAEKALKIVRSNPPEGSANRIEELNRRILSLRPYVGFGVRKKWEKSDSEKYGVPFGAVVAKIDPGSPADRAGLRAGDVIVEYNGSILVDDSQLPWLGAYSKPGSEVKLKIVRLGESKTVNIQVVSMLFQTNLD